MVRFDHPAGQPVTTRTDFGGSFIPAIGTSVDVLFDPDRPDSAHIESRLYDRLHFWFGVICWLIAAGGVAILVTMAMRLGH